MSRAQWCCPAAVLTVAPGFFRGAATASGGGASQAPGPAGQGSAEPPVRVGLRGPEPAAPTPVELSVLRV
ncbi:hypothetical protein OG243_24085 [Streptomyces sp. NBC_01318]|uniref:hypothetical protein n=1 Tax=unclassified Streptomyces TaxID=2593676 RepID=UPI002DDA2F74|nr:MULTISPECIES: hypothetical protein [unclassified Streptomyces]WSC54984.1 hypothetical protein OG808_23475 [Streptomyces sp. NBC_01761]WSJ52367.1 hypothetical protein OG243_24085 [Streptomyces sp. NBC_01318]